MHVSIVKLNITEIYRIQSVIFGSALIPNILTMGDKPVVPVNIDDEEKAHDRPDSSSSSASDSSVTSMTSNSTSTSVRTSPPAVGDSVDVGGVSEAEKNEDDEMSEDVTGPDEGVAHGDPAPELGSGNSVPDGTFKEPATPPFKDPTKGRKPTNPAPVNCQVLT